MSVFSFRRLATQVVVVTVALAAMLTSGAPAQSLGDVARQEEARRKGATTGRAAGAKVYTNDDLKGAPAPAATSPAPAAPSTAAPAALPDAKADAKADAKGDAKTADGKATKDDAKAPPEGKGDQAAWRKRQQALQDALDRSKTFAEALQSRINGLTADFSARDDPAQRSSVANDRQKALTELDRVKKDIELNTKALADLQEEARKSGVPPGWLR